MRVRNLRVAIVGLGYVGLPLAVEFAKKRPVQGFDIDVERISEIAAGVDRTREISPAELAEAEELVLVSDPEDLRAANCYIITVPTPIDQFKKPNLEPLLSASRLVGTMLTRGDLVIYESTVYPGCTEEECVPILEEESGLRFNRDFFCGYSPERVNPGDRKHRLPDIVKVTSGSTPAVADVVNELYAEVVASGTHKAESIRVAEAAKVIENTQRDVNIALINEFAIIFSKLGLDTDAVLRAAETKWNFLPFRPGLVGGHCIGVDPYYLAHKSESIGYRPELILIGRRINDSMGAFVASQLVKAMVKKTIPIEGARVLILGVAFKENTSDFRNTRVIDIVRELEQFGIGVDVYDPIVDPTEVAREYQITPIENLPRNAFDAAILAVAHQVFRQPAFKLSPLLKSNSVLFDLKHILPREDADLRL